MPLAISTIRSLVRAEKSGMWAARNGLNLVISPSGSSSWALRYSTSEGKRRLMKLADYEPIDAASLAALEADAAIKRREIRKGADPLAEREAEKRGPETSAAERAGETFRDAALTYIAENEASWKNSKHRHQWENTLTTYVFPFIGHKLAHQVTMNDVKSIMLQAYERLGVKSDFWTGARETTMRVRSRIEIIIKAARVKALADNGNSERQALWHNHHNPADTDNLKLNGVKGKQVKTNFKAMAFVVVPTFAKELVVKSDYSARALLLTIMCATRTNETINATWNEFDLVNACWVIPAQRMKMGKMHRVPLSHQAVVLLKTLDKIEGNPHVFPGAKAGKPLSNMAMLEALRGMRAGERLTVHGFRSSFRDWITETTLHPDTIAEMALAHSVKDKVEGAYRRGDVFERRKAMMQMWADYLLNDSAVYDERWNKFIA